MRGRMVGVSMMTAACAFLVLLCGSPSGHDSAHAAGRRAAIAVRSGGLVAGPHLQAAARRGNARAQAMLGYAYEKGQGVPQDYVLAVKWYRRAARQGDATGQYLLGMIYDHGLGVHEDKILAEKWLILATASANERQRDKFRRIRDAVASSMTPHDIAHAQALAYHWAQRHRHAHWH